jgi:hypothetical protein
VPPPVCSPGYPAVPEKASTSEGFHLERPRIAPGRGVDLEARPGGEGYRCYLWPSGPAGLEWPVGLRVVSHHGESRAVQKAWDDIERSFEDHAEPYDVVPSELRHTYNSLVTRWG